MEPGIGSGVNPGMELYSGCIPRILQYLYFVIGMPDFLIGSWETVFNFSSPDYRTQCLNVTIIDDESLERNETFSVTLNILLSEFQVMLGITMTMVIIADNDGKFKI